MSRGSTSSAVRRSLIDPSSARAIFAKSSASAIGSPWKLPPLITRPPPVAIVSTSATPPPGKTSGLSVAELHLDVEDAAQVIEGVADGAVDLRDAAQRVRVLDLVGGRVVGVLQAAVAQQVAELRGDRDLARVRAGQLVGRGERHVGPQQRLDALRRRDARRPDEPVGVGQEQGARCRSSSGCR